MKTMHIRPAEGRLVRDPKSKQPIPAEGAEVERSSYWLRRLKDGDVVETTRKKPAAKIGGEE